MFLVAHSFSHVVLSEKCALLQTDNVRAQTSQHIFMRNGGYCLCTPEGRAAGDNELKIFENLKI